MVNTVNAPSLVGMVDPVEGASYELPEQIIPVEVVLIKVRLIVRLSNRTLFSFLLPPSSVLFYHLSVSWAYSSCRILWRIQSA